MDREQDFDSICKHVGRFFLYSTHRIEQLEKLSREATAEAERMRLERDEALSLLGGQRGPSR